MKRFENKSVIVTGGGQGIGRGYAQAFASEGASVALFDLDAEAVKETVALITTGGGSAMALESVDITDENRVQEAAAQVAEALGGIDILINNAGLHLGSYNETIELANEEWLKIFNVNVLGQLNCVRACRPWLAQSKGVVVNQSSDSCYMGVGAYSVSKLALNGLTTSLARELAAEEIRVVGIAPGMVETNAIKTGLDDTNKQVVMQNQLIKRTGSLEEMVGTVMFLASPEAGFITGQTVLVDGGWVQRM